MAPAEDPDPRFTLEGRCESCGGLMTTRVRGSTYVDTTGCMNPMCDSRPIYMRRMHFETAVELAARGHRGQVDKAGEVYLLHPLRVALAVSPQARNVAVLHDVLEDSETVGEAELVAARLSETELEALHLLTKQPSEEDDYAAFIERIATAAGPAGELAREVKLADIRDNLGRLPDSDDPDWVRRRSNYERALERLAAAGD